ncbi:MAG TPA: RDD family protein [Mycobacteriales bacterium]|jgi:uncharacterized RDD family membrane protein YckC|nr:RDD family protein [Mycobacteriales bacterium]
MTTPQDPSEPYGSPPPPYSGGQEPYGQPPQGPPAYTGGGDQYGQQPSQYAGAQLASWIERVGGLLLDAVIFGIPLGIIDVIIGNRAVSDVLGILLSLGLGYLVGLQGQTPGMRILKIKLVRDADGALLGGGLGIVRAICHYLDTLACLVGWLWPLWDNKRQTFADKLMSTVVLKV